MALGYVLYNTKAGSIKGEGDVLQLKNTFGNLKFIEISDIKNYRSFIDGLEKDDYIIVAGGDGTLNRFANDTYQIEFENDVLYYPMGSGNDFAREMCRSKGEMPFTVKEYLKGLPTVCVNGKEHLFINGVGYGIDGYCCEVGDKLEETSDKPVNYTAIAVKGLLFGYKPTAATVTVDGVKRVYENVWLAPVMNGRFYGGGMIPAPSQKRGGDSLSVMVYHCKSKMRSLIVFPSIFKGEHVKHDKMVEVISGHEITVEFDRPTPLQIDGETVLGITSYTAKKARH